MFSLSGKPLKLVDQFIYLSRNIPSTEIDVDIRNVNSWTVIDMLMLKIWSLK